MERISSGYKVEQIYENTWSIADYGMDQGAVFMYLLVGNEKALLIDSGYGSLDLQKIISSITDKEVLCACTHGHIDHALGAYQFEKAYLHSNDHEVYTRHSAPETIRSMGYKGIVVKPSKRKTGDSKYIALVESIVDKPRKELLPLEHIEKFDLGGRTVFWYLLQGHTQGSVAFFDEKYHTIFDGDAAPIGVWMFLPESSSIQDYRENLIKYKEYLEKHAITLCYTGHSNRPLKVKHVQNLIDCCGVILAGKRKGVTVHLGIGEAKIVLVKGTMIWYK